MTATSAKRNEILMQLEAESLDLMTAFLNAKTESERSKACDALRQVTRFMTSILRIDRMIRDSSEAPEDLLHLDVETPEGLKTIQ